MSKTAEEWFRQADYDMETAEYMLEGGRNFYAVFMCHLSIEKALKGLYLARLDKEPPRTHNLILLLRDARLQPPAEIGNYMTLLNQANVATRYPEELGELQRNYTRPIVQDVLQKGHEALQWIKDQH